MPKLWLADVAGVTEVNVEHAPEMDIPHGRAYWVLDQAEDVAMLKGVHLFEHQAEAEAAAQAMADAEETRRIVLARQENPG